MFRPGKSRLRQLPINTLAPNILTMLALCSGLTSIRFSLLDRWQPAVAAIVVAALFDTLDGRLARLLKGASKFGAELDSLSDFISFGVAPVIMLYLWTLQDLRNFGWIVVLAFSVCCALRLARFNTAAEDPQRPVWAGDFFTGVPSPAAAGLVMLPLMLNLETEIAFFRSPWLNAVWTLAIGFSMVTRLPTYSAKRLRVRRDMVLPMLLVTGLFAALLAFEPWLTLVSVGIVYLATLPFSARAYARQRGQRPWPAVPAAAADDVSLTAEPDVETDDRHLH